MIMNEQPKNPSLNEATNLNAPIEGRPPSTAWREAISRTSQSVQLPGMDAQRHQASKTILIVDDDDNVRKLMSMILQKTGWHVLEASSGADGLRAYKAGNAAGFAAVVSDISMPGMDGFTMASEISKINPDQRVLFVSAYPGDYLRQCGLADPDVMLLEKPFTARRLIETMRILLANRPASCWSNRNRYRMNDQVMRDNKQTTKGEHCANGQEMLQREKGLSPDGNIAKQDEFPGGRETLLIVEDEPALRQVLAMAMRLSGYQVLQAEDGVEGLRVFEEHKGPEISLVICDIVMPKLNGIEMVRRLLAIRPGLKILLVSGYPDGLVSEPGVPGPSIGILEKTFSTLALTTAVRDLLDNRYTPPATPWTRPA
jgi:CheY-like chemotaxis protein